ncbi:energy transducer TonB [Ferrimonas balearica]|uniref:energy transducer TonB n=1 Tax=Ferrimonas balearica TaxID=44012 RepID=UPI001C569F1C|nr:energy transducer TonB [Ferrimonas balearica]MBW3138114.1 energy transducer TonB [Ferrimonas balearica]
MGGLYCSAWRRALALPVALLLALLLCVLLPYLLSPRTAAPVRQSEPPRPPIHLPPPAKAPTVASAGAAQSTPAPQLAPLPPMPSLPPLSAGPGLPVPVLTPLAMAPSLSLPELPPSAYQISEVDTPPELIRYVAPQGAGQTGRVLLRLLVSDKGSVSELSVLHGEPAGRHDQAVLNAARQWRFRAAEIQGRAVAVWVEVPISFSGG